MDTVFDILVKTPSVDYDFRKNCLVPIFSQRTK